jgi:hypothetical protein
MAVFGMAALLALAPARAGAPDGDEAGEFVSNVLIHIMHHEAGHALVHQFGLPVLGQEEDAVDGYATIAVLETYEEPLPILVDAAAAWFAMHDQTVESGDEPYYFGEHDLDIQRAYRIICHAYGYDPDTFAEAAKEVELPDDRLESCQWDSAQVLEGWAALLDGAQREEDAEAPGLITVSYGDAKGHEEEKAWVEEQGFLEDIAEWLDVTYAWPEPLSVEAQACGEANAYYMPDGPKLILCYEMVAYLADLSNDVLE